MQSEQDETRLFKGKKKKKPTPQEERVHHQHVLKKKIGQPLFFPVSLSLCCNYIQMKQMNQEAWIITKDQKVILYFFCLAAVSPDKELRLSFVFKHLSRKLNFFPLSLFLSSRSSHQRLCHTVSQQHHWGHCHGNSSHLFLYESSCLL